MVKLAVHILALSDPRALAASSALTSLASRDERQHLHLSPRGLSLASGTHLSMYTTGLKYWGIDASIGAILSR